MATFSPSSSAKRDLAIATSTTGAGVQSGSAVASPFSARNAAQGSNPDLSSSASGDPSSMSPMLIALIVVNCVLAVALLLMVFLFFSGRSHRPAFGSHKYPNPSTNTDTMSRYVCCAVFPSLLYANVFFRVNMYEPVQNTAYYEPYHQPQNLGEIAK
jgi:hypothetical protein